jgi:hypothetical protein
MRAVARAQQMAGEKCGLTSVREENTGRAGITGMRAVPVKSARPAGKRPDYGTVTPFRCVATAILSGRVTGWARRSSRAVPRKRLTDHRMSWSWPTRRAPSWWSAASTRPGAQPLKRAITRHLETPLARKIIAGQAPDGSTVDVAVDGDRLTFTPVIEGAVVDAE